MLGFQIKISSVGCTKLLGVLGDREHRYTFEQNMASARLCFLVIFCPSAKPLSMTDNPGSQPYVLGEWNAQMGLICFLQKLFLVKSYLNIFSIWECCFVEDFKFNHISYRRNCFLLIFKKGSTASPENLHYTKTDEGKY